MTDEYHQDKDPFHGIPLFPGQIITVGLLTKADSPKAQQADNEIRKEHVAKKGNLHRRIICRKNP